ncbi:hypothetical protein QJQ45_026714 [Haematococcus lacustris]|nr:hypothetical protein QJQ45_026714 [Haematococcus lacustris]
MGDRCKYKSFKNRASVMLEPRKCDACSWRRTSRYFMTARLGHKVMRGSRVAFCCSAHLNKCGSAALSRSQSISTVSGPRVYGREVPSPQQLQQGQQQQFQWSQCCLRQPVQRSSSHNNAAMTSCNSPLKPDSTPCRLQLTATLCPTHCLRPNASAAQPLGSRATGCRAASSRAAGRSAAGSATAGRAPPLTPSTPPSSSLDTLHNCKLRAKAVQAASMQADGMQVDGQGGSGSPGGSEGVRGDDSSSETHGGGGLTGSEGLSVSCVQVLVPGLEGAVVDPLGDLLLSLGASSVVVVEHRAAGQPEQEVFEEPGSGTATLWDKCDLLLYFPLEADWAAALKQAGELLELPLTMAGVTASPVPDQQWVAQIKASYQPLQLSPGLWIVPDWSPAPDPDAINITLQPGVAFGTGAAAPGLGHLLRHQYCLCTAK